MTDKMNQTDRQALRATVATFYDAQKLRIQAGNRLVANFRAHLGQEPGMPTEDLDDDAKQIIAQVKEEYRLFAQAMTTANMTRWRKQLSQHHGLLSSPYELVMAEQYFALESMENRLHNEIKNLVHEFAIWDTFFGPTRGCGELLAAVIMTYLDPYKARHVSGFWKYCGLDVAPDGAGRSKRKEHLVEQEYTAKNGEQATRLSITYNAWLRTKLIGGLGASFVKTGGPYRDIYDNYKYRMESHPLYGVVAQENGEKGATRLHRHNMACRYAVKMFLQDLWEAWRLLEGLPVGPTYQVAKLGYVHGETA